MVITSMDINNIEFKKSLRGYDCDKVDEFLDKISEDYETIYKENSFLKEKIELLEEKIKHNSQIEESIQKTLLLAQSASDQARTSAETESKLMIKEANNSAQKIIDKAHNDVIKINDDYQSIKQEFLGFRTKFRYFINTQFETFNNLEKDFMKNYNVGESVDESDIKSKEIEEKIQTNTDIEIDKKEDNENLNEEKFNEERIDNEELDAIKSFFANKD